MVQDAHTRTEKYQTWEKAQRHPIKSIKRWTPHKMTSIQTEDDAPETDIPTNHGLGYASQIFINHTQSTIIRRRNDRGKKVFRQVL